MIDWYVRLYSPFVELTWLWDFPVEIQLHKQPDLDLRLSIRHDDSEPSIRHMVPASAYLQIHVRARERAVVRTGTIIVQGEMPVHSFTCNGSLYPGFSSTICNNDR